jgi:hypothetical protein
MNLAIATMTLDKKGDASLMREALSVLARKKYPVYVADGGSSPEFLADIGKMGFNIAHASGLTPQFKNAITRASKSSHDCAVLYTEPDKLDWFNKGFDEAVANYLASESYLEGKRAFVAVSRTPEQFATFPEHQRFWETRFSDIVEAKIGIRGDWLYGPKFITPEIAAEFRHVNEDFGWGGLTFLLARAHKLGYPIYGINNAASCPVAQRNEDNAAYRERQFLGNIKGFEFGLSIK